jgi:hypothetical protein
VSTGEEGHDNDTYAIKIADESYGWYKSHAIRSRRLHKGTESFLIATSAAIPVAALVAPGNSIVPGVLGAIVGIVSGLRAVFHWQENYLRYSAAREAVERERRLYYTRAKPYNDPVTRAQNLVASVSGIEQDEMKSWMQIAGQRPKPE